MLQEREKKGDWVGGDPDCSTVRRKLLPGGSKVPS